jgi:protein-L-isoaspartate(D-aspartate) O-methyltransferase
MTALKDIELAQVRRYFAEEIRAVCNLRTGALVEALATVPRERFLSPGPWKIRGIDAELGAPPHVTPDDDPRHVYHNVSIVIDLQRQLFNGQPGTLGMWIDVLRLQSGERVLHIGCATGYYTALMAKIVGPSGRITAIEVDPELAARARANLADAGFVDVRAGDAAAELPGSQDAILVNAGVTHPLPVWLDSLSIGGRLILPITFTIEGMPDHIGKGCVFLIVREPDRYTARFVSLVAIYSCTVARDAALNARLQASMASRSLFMVRRLRRDDHEAGLACWLHGDGVCFSTEA